MSRLLFLFLIVFVEFSSQSQIKNEIDSLNSELVRLEQTKSDTRADADSLITKTYLRLLDAYIVTADYDSAISCGLLAEQLAMSRGDFKSVGEAYFGMATANEELGQFALSIQYYESALLMFQKINDVRQQAGVYVGLGNTFMAQANLDKARSYYLVALKFCEETGDEKGLLSVTGNLGNIYFKQKNYDMALEYFLRVIPLAEKFDAKISLAIAYGNIGAIYTIREDYVNGINYMEKALKIKLELGEVKSAALSKYNIGTLYFEQGNYTAALPYFTDAYNTFRSINSAKWIRAVITGMFKCNFLLGDFSSAEKYGRELLDLNQQAIGHNFPILSEKEKEFYLETFEKDIQSFYRYALVIKEVSPSVTSVVYDNVIFNKGILLKSSTAMKQAILSSGNNELLANYENWILLKKQIIQFYSAGKPIDNLTIQADSLEKILIKESTTFSDFNTTQAVQWSDIKTNLDKNEAAIEFIQFVDNDDSLEILIYAALIITPDCENPLMIQLFTDTELKELIGSYRGSQLNYVASLYGSVKNPNTQLYNLVWKPLEPALKGIKKVYISPAGMLHKLSFNAIMFADGSYLCDHYQIELLSSTAKVALPAEFNLTPDSDFLIYGGIDYSSSNSLKDIWSYLPGTKLESVALDSILQKRGYDVDYYSGREATETSFKSNATHADIIHIASHGFFYADPKDIEAAKNESETVDKEIKFRGAGLAYATFVQSDNPLMRSGLVFAGANDVWSSDSISGDDGVLAAQEVAHIDMRQTKLVVLSACETGLGDIKGSEGVYGLQRAFKMAGVKFIIMSLWQVPDKETAEFMTLFYQKLIKYQEIHHAFSETQLAMRKKYDPYYWAAFVLLE